MYTTFFGLSKKPFNMTPDPAFLFLTKQHREALAGLSYAIVERKGFLVLSGVAGCGKTTLLAWVLGKLPADQVQSSVILNPMLKPDEFLEAAMLDFGITDIPKSKARRLWILQNFLLQGQRDGKINVLIIDEAHKVSIELMEEIRLLGNLEHGTDKLLQILLTGQPELEDVLSRPELWQFKQRINVHLSLEALSYEEIDRYIKHRWTVAGGRVPTPFTPEAVAVVMKRSTGIPRLVNSICDNALTLAFADESEKVTVGHVENAARDLRLIPRTAQAPVVSKLTAPAPPPPMRPETERPLASFAAASSAGPNGKPTAVEPAPEETPEFAVPGASQKSLLGRWASKIGLGRNGKNA